VVKKLLFSSFYP